jgi:tetratricopeptide (TPR) repeat protein
MPELSQYQVKAIARYTPFVVFAGTALAITAGTITVPAGLAGIIASPFISEIVGAESHSAFRHLWNKFTSQSNQNPDSTSYVQSAARKAFIQAIQAVCVVRMSHSGTKPSGLRRFKNKLLFSDSNNEINWLEKLYAACEKEIKATEKDNYSLDVVSEKEAFTLISMEEKNENLIASLEQKFGNLALSELNSLCPTEGFLEIVKNEVERMIRDGWYDSSEANSKAESEKRTIFKYACAFFAEELQSNEKLFRIWSAKILNNINFKVDEFSSKLDKNDKQFTERLNEFETAIQNINSVIAQRLSPEGFSKLFEEFGGEISKRLAVLQQQIALQTERCYSLEVKIAEAITQAKRESAEIVAALAELKEDFKAYLIQFNKPEVLQAEFRAVCSLSLQAKYADHDLKRQTEGVLEHYQLLVGRKDVTARIDDFLKEPEKKFQLIAGKAGYGKSALLAEWLRQKQQSSYYVVYHFFKRDNNALKTWKQALTHLVLQLLEYHGYDRNGTIPDDVLKLNSLLNGLLSEVKDQPLILILDGVDEAEFDPNYSGHLFADTNLPESLHMVVSIRAGRDDRNEYIELWQSKTTGEAIYLEEISDPTAIQDWLRHKKQESLSPHTEKLLELTTGYPLYLKFLIDELVKAAEENKDIRNLLEKTPAGFSEYIKQQLQSLSKTALKPKEIQNLFALLATALGAMPQTDVEEITQLSSIDLLGLSWEITRWFTVRKSGEQNFYSFSHPKLAEEFSWVMAREATKMRERLLDYCAEWNKHKSIYTLQHYAAHLRLENRKESLYQLARDKDFLKAIENILSEDPELSLRPVQTALLYAQDIDDAAAMVEFMFHHYHQIESLSSQSPLKIFQETGNLTRAIKLCELWFQKDRERGTLQFLWLIWELRKVNRVNEARKLLCDLAKRKNEIPRLRNQSWQILAPLALSQVFGLDNNCFTSLQKQILDDDGNLHLCLNLVDFGEKRSSEDEKLKIALSVKDDISSNPRMKYKACLEIVQAQVLAGRDRDAYKLIGDIYRENYKAGIYIAIAQTQARMGRESDAIWIADLLDNAYWRANAYAKIAKEQAAADKDATESFKTALQLIEQIHNSHLEDEVYLNIVEAQLADAKRQASLHFNEKALAIVGNALQMVEKINKQTEQNDAYIKIAETFAGLGNIEQAIETAEKIEFRADKAKAYAVIAQAQFAAGNDGGKNFTKALQLIEQLEMTSVYRMAFVFIALAQVKSGLIEDAYQTAEMLTDIFDRIGAYVQIVKEQISLKRDATNSFNKALTINEQRISRDYWKAKSYAEISTAQSTNETRARILKKALTIAKDLSEMDRVHLYLAIAIIQASAGFDKEALETVELIQYERLQVTAYASIAREQSLSGSSGLKSLDKAQQVAEQIDETNQYDKVSAYIDIAEALLALGCDGGEALQMLQKIEGMDWESTVKVTAVKAYLKSHQYNEALEVLKQITDTIDKVKAWCEIAQAYAALNRQEAVKNLEIAFQIAEETNDASESYVYIAKTQAQIGYDDEAIRTTQSILFHRGVFLPQVARKFLKQKNINYFKKLLLPSSYYLSACYDMSGMLALIYPEQSAEIAEFIERQD